MAWGQCSFPGIDPELRALLQVLRGPWPGVWALVHTRRGPKNKRAEQLAGPGYHDTSQRSRQTDSWEMLTEMSAAPGVAGWVVRVETVNLPRRTAGPSVCSNQRSQLSVLCVLVDMILTIVRPCINTPQKVLQKRRDGAGTTTVGIILF